MSKFDPRVNAYIQKRAPFARPILKHLRKSVHSAGRGLQETLKWGMPSFLYKGKIVCGIAGFKAHCALWFWRGMLVVGKKPKEGMGNFGRITKMKEAPSSAKIKACVKKAMKLIDHKKKK